MIVARGLKNTGIVSVNEDTFTFNMTPIQKKIFKAKSGNIASDYKF